MAKPKRSNESVQVDHDGYPVKPEPDAEVQRKSPSPSCGRCVGTGLISNGISMDPCNCTVRED